MKDLPRELRERAAGIIRARYLVDVGIVAVLHQAADEIDRQQARADQAELTIGVREATIHMAVDRLEGMVEGRPTHRGNFLQRIDELREIERRHKGSAEPDWNEERERLDAETYGHFIPRAGEAPRKEL